MRVVHANVIDITSQFMGNTYRVSYTSDGQAHHKHYQALDTDTAASMFLAAASHKHIVVDNQQISVTRVNVDSTSCDGACVCNCHDRRYE